MDAGSDSYEVNHCAACVLREARRLLRSMLITSYRLAATITDSGMESCNHCAPHVTQPRRQRSSVSTGGGVQTLVCLPADTARPPPFVSPGFRVGGA